jgi:hypothetical protein
MGLIVKIIAAGLLLLLFASCFRKKTAAPNLQDWLETNYPGRFRILSTQTDDAIRNLSFKVKKSLVAEQSDTMVQALLKWDVRQTDLGLTKAMVEGTFAGAARELSDAKTLFRAVKAAGFDNVAASVNNWTATILIFAEPTPEHRRQSLALAEKAFAQWQREASYDLAVVYVEPDETGKHFREVVPASFWAQHSSEYLPSFLFQLTCPHSRQFVAADLAGEWKFNTESHRYKEYSGQVRSAVEAWTPKHLKQPFTMLSISEIEQTGHDPAVITFRYPFVKKATAETAASSFEEEPDGYIVADFDVDNGKMGSINISED